MQSCDTAQRGGAANKGTRLCRPDQPQRLRQAENDRSKPTAWYANVLRVAEDDTAALRSSRGNRRGLRRFSQILIDYKSALR
jgi:hypothetical protein